MKANELNEHMMMGRAVDCAVCVYEIFGLEKLHMNFAVALLNTRNKALVAVISKFAVLRRSVSYWECVIVGAVYCDERILNEFLRLCICKECLTND